MIVDALGNPLALSLTGGQVHDITQAQALAAEVQPQALLGDKGYDADSFIQNLEVRAIKPVIPPKSNRKVTRDCDFALYAERNLIERFFQFIKQFRGIATRYEKTARNFLAGLHLVCACVMDRLVLTDAAWERMAPLIIGRPNQKGSTGRDNRMFVEGVLWIVRTGSPWRDLPEAFGDWNSVFRRFSRWSLKGVWWRVFEAMSDDPDFEYLIVDSTIVRAHQHAAGAKKGGLKIKRSAARAAA